MLLFERSVRGIGVYRGEARVLVAAGGEVFAISGRPVNSASRPAEFALSPQQGLVRALEAFGSPGLSPAAFVPGEADAAGFQRFEVPSGLPLTAPLRIRPAYFPGHISLEPAFVIELLSADPASSRAERLVVSAVDGALLAREDLVASAHTYRVYASSSGGSTPLESPQTAITPHPSGTPNGFSPTAIPSALVTMEGFNTGPGGMADPWLTPGATTTNGNNVDAYADLGGSDGFSPATDLRAQTTAAGVFDHGYDFAADPLASSTQSSAAITQLFFTTNWLHDWYYDSGFDEAAGNAQGSNFGRGGVGGDVLLAEAQNGGGQGENLNNANMMTPSDGVSPRMQIFLWSGPRITSLALSPGGSVSVNTADFGPQAFDLTANVALAADGTGPDTSDACEPLSSVAGQIALINRGTCSFAQKVEAAQAAGAVGVVIANNAPGSAPGMAGTAPGVTIPVLSVSQGDGAALATSLLQGAVSATMSSSVAPRRSGSFDSSVVAHEWGHYLQERLRPCATPGCRAMSEGWGDFVALHMLLGAGESPSGAFPVGSYSGRAVTPDVYFGIRRLPYSTNLDINPLTFRYLADSAGLPGGVPINDFGAPNSEVHNAGEVWAAMLFHAYANLIDAVTASGGTFAEAQRLISDYVVQGLSLMPPDTTFLEARDAILAAAAASDPGHAQALAEAFAARGAGSCAVGPDRYSDDFEGIVESFSVSPRIEVEALELLDSPVCNNDDDGVLDAGEEGLLRIWLNNAGYGTASDVEIALDAAVTSSDLLFDAGQTSLAVLSPFTTDYVDLKVSLAPGVTGLTAVNLGVQVTTHDACEPEVSFEQSLWLNHDPAPSLVEDVEISNSGFEFTGADADQAWSREQTSPPLNHFFQGVNLGFVSDTALVTPEIQVATTGPFVVNFSHRFSFEASDGQTWDGAVIELSTDDGATYQDITTWVPSPYNGTVFASASNPLGGRAAFTGQSSGWPDETDLSLDFGDALAGQTVRLRFRIGSDEVQGAEGWSIDDLNLAGVDGMPFTSLVADTREECVPIPDATGGTSGSGSGATDGSGAESSGGGGTAGDVGVGADSGSGAAGGSALGSGATSASGGAPVGGSDGAGAGGPGDSSGCGCSAPGRSPKGLQALAVLLLGLLSRLRRREPSGVLTPR